MCPCSMDGFRVVKLSEVIRQMDVVITCTGAVYTIQLHLVQIYKRKYLSPHYCHHLEFPSTPLLFFE